MKGKIVGIGEVLWDELPDGRKIGGAPANFAYHVTQFGLDGVAVSAVGKDASGAEMLRGLKAKKMGVLMPKVDYPTGSVAIKVDAAGVPEYDIRTDAAWDHIPFTDSIAQLAAETKAVCFGSLAQRSAESRATIMRFLDSVPSANNPLIVFDINLRQNFYSREVVENSLKRCNILKINDEELAVVSEMFSLPAGEACVALIDRFGLDKLILTCGTDGSYVYSGGAVSFQPTPVVEVADTVGAGDSFTASFVAALLRGDTVARAHEVAARTSAYVCTRFGAMPELPDHITAR